MLLSYYVSVFSDIKWQFYVYILVDDRAAVAFYGITVIYELFQISPDRLLGDVI